MSQIGSERGAEPPAKPGFSLLQVWGRRGIAGLGGGAGCPIGDARTGMGGTGGHTHKALTGSPVPPAFPRPAGAACTRQPPHRCGDSSRDPLPQTGGDTPGVMTAPLPSIIPAEWGRRHSPRDAEPWGGGDLSWGMPRLSLFGAANCYFGAEFLAQEVRRQRGRSNWGR